MYYVYYKNSVLASIVSVLGCLFVTLGIMSLFEGGMDVVSCIAMIALGVLLAWLGRVISKRKEKKKQAKAAAQAAAASQAPAQAPAANAGYTQPAYSANVQTPAAAPVNVKPVKASAVFAGIFFLVAAASGLLASFLKSTWMVNYTIDAGTYLELASCFILMFCCFSLVRSQEVIAAHTMGFGALMVASAEVALRYYQAYGFGGYSASDGSIHYAMAMGPLFKLAAFLLMLIFTLCAMKNAKSRFGGIVRVLWLVPVLLLLIGCSKSISESGAMERIQKMIEGNTFRFRPEFADAISQVFLVLAVLFTAFCYMRVCRKTPAGYVQPAPQPAAAVPPVQAAPVQPQSQPRYTAPEPPVQPVQPEPAAPQANAQDTEKKRQALQDLLDCGILTQAEYEEKIRELTHG